MWTGLSSAIPHAIQRVSSGRRHHTPHIFLLPQSTGHGLTGRHATPVLQEKEMLRIKATTLPPVQFYLPA